MKLRLLTSLAVAGALCAPALAQQSTQGQWQTGPNLPFFPVHLHELPTGKLMMWPGDDGISGNDPHLFDPATGIVTQLALPGYDVFCSGHSLLPDGRLFVAGGHISNNVGLSSASIYDPVNNVWIRQQNMNLGRWYPTDQVLPNGDVVVISGDVDLSTGNNPLPQVWQAATGTWRSLTSAQLQSGLYPTMSLAPNGKVFVSGPSVTTRYLDTTGTGAWTPVADHPFQGIRDYDGMVMYQPGKVLVTGGSDPATNTAETIDLNAATPAWQATAPMAFARRQLNATMLPDGKVLVTGGTSGPGFSDADPNAAVYAAEEWDPATGQWTTLASATVPRLYHSIAMLLPDGRIINTGGNGYTQIEYFSPPYLFAGPRPTITSAPANVANGQQFFVGTPDAANISSVSWVRLPSNTHGLSMSQAFYSSSSITATSGGIVITSPNDPTLPAGYYMLFVLNHGVPSVASVVHLGLATATYPAPSVSALSPVSGFQGDPPTTVTISGANFSDVSIAEWNGQPRSTTFISANQVAIKLLASDLAALGTGQISVITPGPGGGSSQGLTFTINQPAVPNLTQTGSIIARITSPGGTGNRSLEVIRDGDMPPVGTADPKRQYDTYSGGGFASEDWIGYQYAAPQTFAKVVFQEGMNFVDGGYFSTLNVQVLQNGTWVNVPNAVVTPAYPPNDSINFETYTFTFPPITGNGIRIDGAPGATSYFTSVAELQIFGPATTLPTLTSMSPTTANNGDSPFQLTVNGTNFSTASMVQWNGTPLPTQFVSGTKLLASVPAVDVASAGTAQVSVSNGVGATSSNLNFTVNQASVPNLTQIGSIIANITAPTGGGSRNLEIIRDGDMPPVGNTDSSRQYDTYHGGAYAAEDWIGYQYAGPQTFAKVVFQEGKNFVDGGWFNNLRVQVRQNGTWVSVAGLVSTPVYPANDNINYETYTLTFTPVTGDAIRIDGPPGGGAYFISVGELMVYGAAATSTVPTLSSMSPTSANNGDSPFKLTVNGTNFSTSSVVQWNGTNLSTAYVSATQLVASVPAADVAAVGTAHVTVSNGVAGTSPSLTFTINQATVPNLTQTGSIIANIAAPTGTGNHNLEVIRDGDMPPVGNTDSQRQYDTYHGGAYAAEDWIGYQYASPQTFTKVVFQEGKNFVDGGWFNTLNVQVRQNGVWINVPNLMSTPTYPPNDNVNYETYTLTFTPIAGDAIRIDGAPGGGAYFISVGELMVYGQ